MTVAGDHLTVAEGPSALHLRRDRVAAVFTDGRDLVVPGHADGALADKQAGAAGDALDQLRTGKGVAVRDRDGAQQYRRA